MMRGLRVLRYVVIAIVLLLVVFKISTNNVDFKKYTPSTTGAKDTKASSDSSVHGTTGSIDFDASTGDAITSDRVTGGGEGANVPYQRENATFVTLCRNSDLWNIIDSIRDVEDRFNHKYHYDWVFLNDDDFTDEFKSVISSFVSGNAIYGKIPPEHWGMPEWIDKDKAALAREKMVEEKVIYGGSVPYRYMCRYESGFFFENSALDAYKYYWRVEPDINLFCDIDFDVFKFMRENKKRYGFVISLYEYIKTVPTLWDATKEFIKLHPDYLAKDNAMGFVSDDGGETYNLCHFWSNFEVGDLDFYRSDAYREYFKFLDQKGGFFYERWGDAPVHSIAAALFMKRDEIHFFEDIGYRHVPFQSCPTSPEKRNKLRCTCPYDVTLPQDQRTIFTWKGYSCTPRWFKLNNLERPAGWSDWTD